MNKLIVFDYDGTIHKSDLIYLEAVKEVHNILIKEGLLTNKDISEDKIKSYIGLNIEDMWNDFAPNLTLKDKNYYGNMIGNIMNELIENNKALLYENSISTLQYLLDKGYKLIILSNCKRKYMDISRKVFKLDNYFIDFYCAEDYNYIPKHEIIKTIIKDHGAIEYIVGDKESDIKAGIKNNINTIGCNYGFGSLKELQNSSYLIDSIIDIKNIIF